MENGIKCFECRFTLDDGYARKQMVKYVFTQNRNMIEKYLKDRVATRNDDSIHNLIVNEIKIMEGVVL